jgi:hypothetical protein
MMFVLALAHGRILACRATYGFVPKQGQAAKPIAIESASFVAVSISFLQKKYGCPLWRGQRNSITVGRSGVLFEHVCPLYRPPTSPFLSVLFHRLNGIRERPRPCHSRRNTHTHTHPTQTSPRPSHLIQTLLTKPYPPIQTTDH